MKKENTKLFVRKSVSDRVIDFVVYFILIFVLIISVYPLYLAVVLSFNEGVDAQLGGIYLWPRKITLDNYAKFFSDITWLKAMGVTLARTIVGTACTVMFTAFVAYGLSHRNLVGRKTYMKIFIFAMYFSGGIIPYYAVLRTLGLLDSFLVYIVPSLLNLFYVLVAISFFEGIPDELEEAARVDGATEMTTFIKVILPVAMPLLATISIFVSVQHWNSWYDSAFFVKDENLRTLAYRMMAVLKKSDLSNVSSSSAAMATSIKVTPLSVQLAAMVIAALPIVVVYPFFQRYIISGITIGSVKG